MNFWILGQIILDIIVIAAVAATWYRLNKPAKDDPRLSRGLQLLQSKIAVLEDLADRTDTQVVQLNALMDQKIKDVQGSILNSDKQLQKIDQSVQKSLEVSKIFQDKIPHQEIIERQNSLKYIQAARLAHQGLTVQQIAQQVDLSIGEIEFIAKVNKEQLQFSEDDLPDWAKGKPEAMSQLQEQPLLIQTQQEVPVQNVQFTQKSDLKIHEEDVMAELGSQFRKALSNQTPMELAQKALDHAQQAFNQAQASAANHPPSAQGQAYRFQTSAFAAPATAPRTATPKEITETAMVNGKSTEVKKVIFPRIDINQNLS